MNCPRCSTPVPEGHSHCSKCAGYARRESAYGVSLEQDIGLAIRALLTLKSVTVWSLIIRTESNNEYRVTVNEHHHAQDPDLFTALQLVKRYTQI